MKEFYLFQNVIYSKTKIKKTCSYSDRERERESRPTIYCKLMYVPTVLCAAVRFQLDFIL